MRHVLTRPRRTTGIALACLVLAGCASPRPGQVTDVSAIDSSLDIVFDTCGAEYELDIEETPTEILVDIRQTGAGRLGGDCVDAYTIALEDDVAPRQVVIDGERHQVRHRADG